MSGTWVPPDLEGGGGCRDRRDPLLSLSLSTGRWLAARSLALWECGTVGVWVPRAGAAALARLAARWLWAGRPLVTARPDLHGWASVAGWAKHAAQCTERRATPRWHQVGSGIPSVLRPDARCPPPAACPKSQPCNLRFLSAVLHQTPITIKPPNSPTRRRRHSPPTSTVHRPPRLPHHRRAPPARPP